MTPVITLTDAPDVKARTAIENGLSGYNKAQAGYSDGRRLAVLVSDPDTHEVVGGLIGHTSLGACFVDLVFLPDHLRGQDIGTRMMDQAEDEARRRGCHVVVLYTISFQAPGFYEKRGYQAFGKIDCHPPGTSRIFMRKDL
jgi:GNAT superfamily N-acetyltransferase